MSTARFFVPLPLTLDTRVVLPEEVAHHALRVLRLRVGDAVVVFNGTGGEFHGTLSEGAHGASAVELTRFDAREAELAYRICIGQGLCASEKMDWIFEKAVELGASALQALTMQRSVTRLAGERARKREAHWQQIAASAAEQCGRNRIAHVFALRELDDWLEDLPRDSLRLMLDPQAQHPLKRVDPPAAGATVLLLIGPEAGMTPAEKALAIAADFLPVSLGSRVLRTETAALAALATLSATWPETAA